MLIFLDTGKGACPGGVALLILPAELERDLALLYILGDTLILYRLLCYHWATCTLFLSLGFSVCFQCSYETENQSIKHSQQQSNKRTQSD